MKTFKWAAVALLFFALVSIVPGHSSAQFRFSDISSDKEYFKEVHYIADLGIVNQADKFNPGNNLTRAHAAKMLGHCYRKKGHDYAVRPVQRLASLAQSNMSLPAVLSNLVISRKKLMEVLVRMKN